MTGQTTLFSVGNRHAKSSGKPPSIDGNTVDRYHGYFENEYGEQAIFTYDCQAQEGKLRLGDAGWGQLFPVTDGRAPDLILNEAEAMWLKACWLAATAGQSNS